MSFSAYDELIDPRIIEFATPTSRRFPDTVFRKVVSG